MGLYDPQMRVGTSGTGAAMGRNYATNAATAGRVLTSQGDNLPPQWAAPAPGVAPVAQTFFVDAVNFSATPTGTLGAPFQTIQQAVNQAVANAWVYVQIVIAPATYVDPIAIPAGLQIAFTGWSQNAVAILSGDITIVGGIGSSDQITFENCAIFAANITAADPLTQDIDLNFYASECFAVITGFNVLCDWRASTQAGNVNAGGGLTTSWDDWSWTHTLNSAPVFTVGGVYTRSFWGTGHDTFPQTITVNGVVIGTTVFVDLAVPAYTRADDRVQIQVADPAVRDFLCGVHGVAAGVVTVWITNLSRVSTNFADDVLLLVHHNDMIVEP